MIERITIDTYYKSHSNIPIVDVRSPGEFEKGQMPGAFNIPLFSNEERAQVGTMYKQKSQKEAIELGYKFVNPKLGSFISESTRVAHDNTIAVHCWRGGMRSEAFAQHLHENGFEKVYVIERGYKAFRNYVLSFFENSFKLKILGGYTGSGKTDILPILAEKGEQVLDLEELAHHKGSAFGAIGERDQPTVEQFENNLFDEMRKLNREKTIWIEDESMSIGKVFIPRSLFIQMREQQVYFLDIPAKERADYLVQTYGLFNKENLKESIVKITKRIGYDNANMALEALEKNDLLCVAEITLKYYDKAYKSGLDTRDSSKIIKVPLPKVDAIASAKALINC
jgi:tRNA 2-selenouridine synthase